MKIIPFPTSEFVPRFCPFDLRAEIEKCYTTIITLDRTGQSPPHWAVRMGNPSAVRLILQPGANINAMNMWDATALHRACQNERAAKGCILELLEAGTNVRCCTKQGYQPICYAFGSGKATRYCLILHLERLISTAK
jgi:ankyrin repeat protein